MRRIDVLLTSDVAGGALPFVHGEMTVRFHRFGPGAELPLIDGTLWAFVDWVLPDISGLELCRRLRSDPATADAHVTLILEDDDADCRRRALRSGADDYMKGPASRAEILDRILSVDLAGTDHGLVHDRMEGDLTINVAAFQARWQGRPIALMPNEFRLLRYFVEHPGRVLSRSQLMAALGKGDLPIDERTVDVWIGRLRRALRSVGANDPLRTVRSLGYVYDPD